MTNENKQGKLRKLKKHIRKLEKEKKKLSEELENERIRREKLEKDNEDLRGKLAQLLGSVMVLAASDKTAEAGGVPSSKIFYKRNRNDKEKKPTGGQPGHKGHGRKRPVSNSPSLHVTLDSCPFCGNSNIREVKSAKQQRTVTDIPPPTPRIYDVIYHRYWCDSCKKLVRGEVSWLPPHQEFGPFVASWVTYHRLLGLTLGKIRSSLFETYSIPTSDDTILKLERWVADTLKDDYNKLKVEIVKAKMVNADETKFRIGGENGWLWVFVNKLISLFVVAPTRSHAVPEEILDGFEGVLGRDGWKPYDFVHCSAHQLDLIHVNRWLERAEVKHGVEPRTILSSKSAILKDSSKCSKEFLEFADGVRSILKRSIDYLKKPPPLVEERRTVRFHFQDEMEKFLSREWEDSDAIRISKELLKRLNMLFTFVEVEGVPWHNNDAEQAVRKGVLARKISGGRRTWTGAEVYQILLTTLETSKKRNENFIEIVTEKLGISSTECLEYESAASKT
jgi:transposase